MFTLSNPNCSDFDLQVVTAKLGITPTRARKKNEFPPQSIAGGFAGDYWSFEIREKNCQDIAIPFRKMFDLLKDKAEIINTLCSDLNIITDFVAIIHVKVGNRPLNEIPKDVISFISSINAGVGFDLYCYDKDNDFDFEPFSK